jgi:hypothetical protein
MAGELLDNASGTGSDSHEGKLELGPAAVDQYRTEGPEHSQITTFSSAKTDSPFFIRDLHFSHEEEKRIIRIIDTRLFRMWLPLESEYTFTLKLY